MNLPVPPAQYKQGDEAQARRAIQNEDKRNVKTGGPYLIQSPDGTWWKLSADNAGALTLVAA